MIISIDPGERWTGFAILTETEKRTAHAGVLDGSHDPYYPVDFLKRLLVRHHPRVVVVEDFQARPVGHQRFSRVLTARIIGAMEYVTLRSTNTDFTTEPTGDPDRDLKLMKLSTQVFVQWQPRWPQRQAKEWHHARSAWRVMGMHLLKTNPDLLRSLKIKMVSVHRAVYEHDLEAMNERLKVKYNYLWAPPAILR